MHALIHKKLKMYSALATSVAAMGLNQANSTTVYTDVDPDTSIGHNQMFNLDLNGDNLTDFSIQQLKYFSSASYYGMFVLKNFNMGQIVTNNNNNAVVAQEFTTSSGSTAYAAGALKKGDTINAAQNWKMYSGYSNNFAAYMAIKGSIIISSNYYGYYSNQFAMGPWLGQTDAYAGLKFEKNGQIHYGWVRLGVDDNLDSIVVKDYAYYDVPNSTVLAGDTIGLLIDTTASDTSANIISFSKEELPVVYSFDKNVYLGNLPVSGSIHITSITGEKAIQKNISTTEDIISLLNHSAGVYVIQLRSGNKLYTKKVAIN
jgi:hypothetical protein